MSAFGGRGGHGRNRSLLTGSGPWPLPFAALRKVHSITPVPLRAELVEQSGISVHGYLPTARAAMALSISALMADILKLALACIGGKSISVCAALPTTCWTKRQG